MRFTFAHFDRAAISTLSVEVGLYFTFEQRPADGEYGYGTCGIKKASRRTHNSNLEAKYYYVLNLALFFPNSNTPEGSVDHYAMFRKKGSRKLLEGKKGREFWTDSVSRDFSCTGELKALRVSLP